MLILSQDLVGQRLLTYAQKFDSTANRWNTVDSSIASADRYVESSDRQFEQAKFPQRQAQFDDASTDSSWHGRDLQRQFQSGSRDLDSSEGHLRRGGYEFDTLRTELAQNDRGLDQLISEMRASNDSRLPLVLQASGQIDQASQSFNGVETNFKTFGSSKRWTDNSVRRADSPIFQIANDRPGDDVSSFAYQVGDSLREIERELQNIDDALRNADRQGDSGQSELKRAAQKLMQAGNTGP